MEWLVGYTAIGVLISLVHHFYVAKEKTYLSLKDLFMPENLLVAPLWPFYLLVAGGVGFGMLYDHVYDKTRFDPEQVILWKKKQ